MKTALVQHWLVKAGGAERVFQSFLDLFPGADIFTLVYDREHPVLDFGNRAIHTSFLQQFPRATRWYPAFLPMYPLAAKRLDLTDFDLVISSDAAIAKAVRTRPNAIHICYCHTPMRYVWSGYETYRNMTGRFGKDLYARIAEWLRYQDFEAAQKVTHFVANSRNVAGRISRYYARESTVIYPPVRTDYLTPSFHETNAPRDYLLVARQVRYKRVDLVVEAFNQCGKPLVIIGEGPERTRLAQLAGPNIRFLGYQRSQ